MSGSLLLPRPTRFLGRTALLLAAAAALVAPFDLALSRSIRAELGVGVPWPIVDAFERFGNGATAALVVATLMVCDRRSRHHLWRVVLAVAGSGLAVIIVKACVGRLRPDAASAAHSIGETFVGFFPLVNASAWGIEGGWRVQSFPSGHTAVAVALALGLAQHYPRWRTVLLTLAVGTMLQRIAGGRHFVVDTLFGAALACAVTRSCMRFGLGSGAPSEVTRSVPAQDVAAAPT